MESFNDNNGVEVSFVNYNYSFGDFYQRYKDLCLSISETKDLKKIRRLISSFMYDFDFGIPNYSKRIYFRESLREIRNSLKADLEYSEILNKSNITVQTEIKFNKKFYGYFLSYLNLLSSFAEELTASFMPNTNIQKKLLKFSNNQFFFEKMTEYKKIVNEKVADFSLLNFKTSYNGLVTFYSAYKLFVNNKNKILIEGIFTNVLSQYLCDDIIRILVKFPNIGTDDREKLQLLEELLHEGLLNCNSLMNESFSDYRILPKLTDRVYVDKTLI